MSVQTPRGTQPNQFRQPNLQSGWHGEGNRGGGQHSQHVASFCKEHGTKFSHGFYYVGRNQKHFTERWYDAHFECYLYFDPYAQCPYYWCEAHGVFYPIEYIETVGPNAQGPGPIVAGARGGAPVGGATGGAPAGGGAPVGDGSAAGPVNGAPVGGAGGAPVGGAAGGAVAPTGGGAAAAGGASADDDSAAGSEEGAADGAAAGGAGGAAPGAASGGAGAAGAAAAKPVGAASGVSVAKNRTPVAKKELQQVPGGTFDDAIPEEPK